MYSYFGVKEFYLSAQRPLKGRYNMVQLNFNIEDICGTLSENKDGWRKELTYISWNNRAAKFDLRSWDPDYQAMTKGITMTKDELIKLKDILNNMDFDKY